MNKKIGWLKQLAVVGLFAAALAISGASNAQELVQNGEFATPTPNMPFSVADWSSPTGINYVYRAGCADQTCGTSTYQQLWGPANGGPTTPVSIGGLTTQVLTPTDPLNPGSNFVAADADPSFHGPISQTISLTEGQAYDLTFSYAAAQYKPFTGATGSAWQVSLGGTVLSPMTVDTPVGCPTVEPCSSPTKTVTTTTTPLVIPSMGFSGWQQASVPFIAPGSAGTSVKELLSFLAEGTGPDSLPPVALLDSVSITAIPPCVPGSVASYIGMTCHDLDKAFSNFKYTPTAIGNAIASSALQTMITPIMSGNNEGFNIQGLWDAGPGGAADGVLSYTVQSLAGDTIDDASLGLTGSAIGGGFATVGETICEGDLLSDGCASGRSATLLADLPDDPTDTITFAPTDLVDISKDIDVFGGSGFASLSDVTNTVSQTASTSTCPTPASCIADPPTVPEPPSLALLGVGLAGLAGIGLRRRRRG